jgi:hypothetical protein
MTTREQRKCQVRKTEILQSHSRLVQAQQRTPQEERLIPAASWLVAAAMLGALLAYAVVSVGVPAKVDGGSSGGANSDGRVEALRIAAADGTEAPLQRALARERRGRGRNNPDVAIAAEQHE